MAPTNTNSHNTTKTFITFITSLWIHQPPKYKHYKAIKFDIMNSSRLLVVLEFSAPQVFRIRICKFQDRVQSPNVKCAWVSVSTIRSIKMVIPKVALSALFILVVVYNAAGSVQAETALVSEGDLSRSSTFQTSCPSWQSSHQLQNNCTIVVT